MTTPEIIQIDKNLFYQLRKSLYLNDLDQQLIKKVKNAMVEINIPPPTLIHSSSNPSSCGSSPATTPTIRKLNIFNNDFSRASQQKKFITSYLNKLTESNKDKIFKKIENDIAYYSPEETDKAIKQIFVSLRSHKDTVEMYYDLLMLFEKAVLRTFIYDVLLEEYISNKQWIPPQKYQDEDVYSTNCDYDLYCSFCSWKNGAIAICRFFFMYLDNTSRIRLINLYMDDIYANLDKRIFIDPILEQLECLLIVIDVCREKVKVGEKDVKSDILIIRKLLSIKKEELLISSFFKIKAMYSRKNDITN
tara:strand:- start:2798 stop:3712 length:915 start_codon:yes stop_codon:yes gene_type:complete